MTKLEGLFSHNPQASIAANVSQHLMKNLHKFRDMATMMMIGVLVIAISSLVWSLIFKDQP
jgi:uncharacterized YccA/Bax inhibitor family protein